LNLRIEVARVQYISLVVARAAERILQASCLRVFTFPALHPGNRKVFLNFSLTSYRIRRLIAACKYRQSSSSSRAAVSTSFTKPLRIRSFAVSTSSRDKKKCAICVFL